MADQHPGIIGFYQRRRLVVWVVGLAVVLFGVVVYLGDRDRVEGGVAQSNAPGAATDEDSPRNREEPTIVRRDPTDPMALGEVDAPVVIVEWLDMRCPFCALFSRETLPDLVETYIDGGLVRYEVREAAIFGAESIDGAVAARAAGEQGRFHEFLTAVYAAAPERGKPDLPRERLVAFAAEAGVPDLERFEADLDREDLRQAVQESTSTAGRLGVTSVPFFLIGDVAFSGAQPLDSFARVIDEQLAEAQTG